MERKEAMGGSRDKSWACALSGLALIGLLSGCGGGGGSAAVGADPGPTPIPAAVSGVVADGYLQGATVCLDVNLNKACDTGEPTATTGAGGKYTLDAAALALLPENTTAALFPVLVKVPATAIDEDTMAAVGKEYVMAAPAGKPEFVSPMTTLVQNQIESNPALTASDAETLVKAQIGVSADSSLFENYVEPVVANVDPSKIEARAEELARVRKVAQVVARTMAEMKESVQQVAQDSGIDLNTNYAAIVKLVTEEVMTRLQTINDAVAQTTGTFNPQTVVSQVATIDTTTVAAKIEANSTVVAKSSFARMLEGEGTFWFDHWMDNNVSRFEYGNVKLPTGVTTPVEAHFVWTSGAWQADTSIDPPGVILTATGWQPFADGASNYTVMFNAVDGTALLTHTATGLQEKLSAVELDLAGKSHGAMAGRMIGLLVDPTATFPVGAKGFMLTFVPQQESYTVDFWADAQGVDQNFVRVWDQPSNQEVAVTSLTELQSLFAAGSQNYLEVGGDNGYSLAVQFATGGTLNCFKRPWNGMMAPQQLLQTGSWSQIQLFGQTLVKLSIPEQYRALAQEGGQPFFVVRDGVVKRGRFQAAGMIDSNKDLNFNKAAFDSLSVNVNFNFVPAAATGTQP